MFKYVKTCSKPNNASFHIIKTKRFASLRAQFVSNRATVQNEMMDQTERDLIVQVAQLNTRKEFLAWEQRCNNFIESLKE